MLACECQSLTDCPHFMQSSLNRRVKVYVYELFTGTHIYIWTSYVPDPNLLLLHHRLASLEDGDRDIKAGRETKKSTLVFEKSF